MGALKGGEHLMALILVGTLVLFLQRQGCIPHVFGKLPWLNILSKLQCPRCVVGSRAVESVDTLDQSFGMICTELGRLQSSGSFTVSSRHPRADCL